MCLPLSAQWLDYPTAGIPRTPDGKPNLKAPVPKAADGKPDLSGIWGMARVGQNAVLINIASKVQGGVPYRPETEALVKARRALDSPYRAEENVANCRPIGIVFRHHQALQKLVQVPGLLIMLNEYNKSYRQIFTDGRPFPEDRDPNWDGYSVGKWDGDTLVVETIGFRDDLALDIAGHPMSADAKITERFHRTDFGHMAVDVTIDDAKYYTKPWTATLLKDLQPDTELLDFICSDNEKDTKHIKKAVGAATK